MTTKTALFAYIGTDKRGRESRGEIEATSISMVKAQLRKRGITAKSVRKNRSPYSVEEAPK
jgi:Type II secretory pathway, component PulF